MRARSRTFDRSSWGPRRGAKRSAIATTSTRSRPASEFSRGGEGASVALAKVDRMTAAEIAALARPVIKAAESEQKTLTIKTLESARAFLADVSALASSEHALNDYLQFAEQPVRVPIAIADAKTFVARAERILNPPTRPVVEVNRGVRPVDFSDLVAS
jgi:hypothetical protein